MVVQIIYIIISSILTALGTVVSAMLLAHLRRRRTEEMARLSMEENRDRSIRNLERRVGIIEYYSRKKKFLPANGAEAYDSADFGDS